MSLAREAVGGTPIEEMTEVESFTDRDLVPFIKVTGTELAPVKTPTVIKGTAIGGGGSGGGEVTGVKGDSESSYRKGNVNITKANIGLGNVENKSASTLSSEIMTSENVKSVLGCQQGGTKYLKEDGSWDTPAGGGGVEQIQSDWNQTNTSAKDYIKNKPTSMPANGGNAATVNSHSVEKDVPSDAVFTDHTYSVMGASGSTHASGLVPDTPTTAGTSKFLREDGQWAEPQGGGGGGNTADVNYDTTNKKITKTIDGVTSDVVTVATLKTDMNLAKGDVGLGNVGNFKAVSTESSQGLTDTEKGNARANIGASSFSGSYSDLSNKPTIPTSLSQLSDDATHRTVTDTEKSTWNGKQDALQKLTTNDGKGHIYDKADSVLTTSAFFTQTNTVYHIRYNHTLTANVLMPSGSTLSFEGGVISGGYTLTGTNTAINADIVQIFGTNVKLEGTWNIAEAYTEWFGAKGDGNTDDSVPIRKVLEQFKGYTIRFLKDRIYVGGYMTSIFSNTKIIIDGTIAAKSDKGISFELFVNPGAVENGFYTTATNTPEYTGVHDVVICGSGTIDAGGNTYRNQNAAFRIHHCKNITVKDITIKGTYMWHSIESGGSDNCVFDNLTIYSTEYDNAYPSTMYNSAGVSLQFEDNDSSSANGALPYDDTPTRNAIVRNCKFLVSQNSPYYFDYVGGNHANDSSDTNGDAIHDIIVENCYFEGDKRSFVNGVIFNASSYNIHVRNCKFENMYQGRACCFGSSDDTSYIMVRNAKVENCEFINCQRGVLALMAKDIYVENSLFRGTEEMDGNRTIDGEYTKLNNLVTKSFYGVHVGNSENIHVTNCVFNNINLGITATDPSSAVIQAKDLFVIGNTFRDLATAAVFIYYPEGKVVINNNIVENPIKYPSLENQWSDSSAVCIGASGNDNLLTLYCIENNIVQLYNPNCGNIFHKPTAYNSVNTLFKDNVVVNIDVLSSSARELYNTMVSRFAINGTKHKADTSAEEVSVFEYD